MTRGHTTPPPHALEEYTRDTLARAAEVCAADGHRDCGPELCRAAWEAQEDALALDAGARAYDIAVEVGSVSGQPTAEWPTAALLRTVSDQLRQPPWEGSRFCRSMLVTSALARLGERGILADAVMRTAFADILRRQIVVHLVGARRAVDRGEVTVDDLPVELADWLPLLDECDHTDGEFLLVDALTGAPSDELRRWLQDAAVAHLLDWRRDALSVRIDPEDMVLPAGAEATHWVADRFTHTSLDSWRPASLSWELAFTRDDAGVADRVGVPVSVLRERPVSQQMVVTALARRITAPGVDDVVLADMTATEILENLVALAGTGNHEDALELAGRAVHRAPDNPDLRLAWAFMLITTDPPDAERRLRRTTAVPGRLRGLHRVNLAAAMVRRGGDPRAAVHQAELALREPDLAAWLWDARRLGAADTLQLTYTTTHTWVTDLAAAYR